MADDEIGAGAYCPDGFVTTQAYLLVLEQLTEARAELARWDTTIATQQPVIDAATAWVRNMEGSRDACMGTAAALIAAVDTYRAVLSAPVEALIRNTCGCCGLDWPMCHGLVERGSARCCADCTHDLSAPVEAGTPAEPVCGDVHRWAGYENVCVLAPHEASEASPHVCSAGTTWWPNVVEAGAPAAEPAPDRPGICPTCESSQPHLHPHRDLCSDPWHKPVPTTVDGWRREVERWAGLLHQIAEFGSGIPDVRRSADLIADDISRALAGPADDTTREAADV